MDATISVVCYKSKTLSNGEHPLMLRISKDGKKKYQSLGISVNPKFWDFQKNKPKPKCPNLEYLQKIILDKKLELQKKKLEIKSDQKEYSAATLLEANANLLVAKTVDCFYKEIIAQCEINNKCGNRLVYLNSYNSLKRFTNGKLEIPFNSINVAWLEKYEKWLRSNGNKETTISLMFRTLRSTYGRYRHYFEISSTHYYDMSKDERHERFVLPTRFKGKDADFLDVEFEFIKGRAETPAIQNLIKEWVHDSGQVLTIAVCLNYPPQSMAMGLYLPDDVYDENIPVFVRQETSSALLNMLNSKKKDEAIHKYSHVFPFGMLDNCYDLDKKSRREGQIINYIYDFKNKYGNVPQSCPPDNELKDSWNKLSVSLQWSNLYSAYSISPKLRSIGITDGYVKLDNDQITLLAEVEHNRWNMEKLLLGFRKPTAEEEELIYGSKEMGDIFKKKRFVHPDIRPYDELKESSKAYDRCITAGIPLVVNNNT